MDFKKCFKEKEIVVYSRKRIKLKHARWGKYQEMWKWEQYIQINEHMSPLIKWSQDDFHNEPLVNIFESSEMSSWLQLRPSRNRHSSVETLHWFIFARTALSGFQPVFLFSWDAFFFFLYCFTARFKNLNFVQNEKKIYFPKEEIL